LDCFGPQLLTPLRSRLGLILEQLLIPGFRIPEPRWAPAEAVRTVVFEEVRRVRIVESRIELLHDTRVNDGPWSKAERCRDGTPAAARWLAVLGDRSEIIVFRLRGAAREVSGVVAGHQAQHGDDLLPGASTRLADASTLP